MKKIFGYIVVMLMIVTFVACESINETTIETTDTIETTTASISTTEKKTLTPSTTLENTEDIRDIFIIEFDSMSGSIVQFMSVLEGSSIDLPVPTREGYSFLGWTMTNDIEASIVPEPFSPESSITLYAKWILNQYTITFDTNGGSSIESITQDYNSSITKPADPVKEGYIFLDWYMDSALTTPYVFDTMPSLDMTLYAHWEEEDWSDVELYLSNQIPSEISDDISLPESYNEYAISWVSNNEDVVSHLGVYQRPYQTISIILTATIQIEDRVLIKNYEIEVAGYKSLVAPLASSYIYREYDLVNDTFFDTLDVINCAFITANSAGTLTGTRVLANINTYIMPKAREKGNWVLFSIAPDSEWSSIASNTTRINTFADNIVNLINQYGFDGVDIDWETPTDDEAERFTLMMEVIYTKVKENNPNHLVTAAIAGGMWQPPRYDLENSHQYIDYINMMTYGMVSNNGYYQNALSQSKTYDDPTNSAGKTLTSCSIEESIDIYNSYGIPNGKIIVGVAFYGLKQTRSYNSSNQTWSNWIGAGSVSYTSITNNYLGNSNYEYHYDNEAGVPYIISKDGTVFISYDNPRSIADKSEYIIDNGLGGMMYWENGLDYTGALLLAIDSNLK